MKKQSTELTEIVQTGDVDSFRRFVAANKDDFKLMKKVVNALIEYYPCLNEQSVKFYELNVDILNDSSLFLRYLSDKPKYTFDDILMVHLYNYHVTKKPVEFIEKNMNLSPERTLLVKTVLNLYHQQNEDFMKNFALLEHRHQAQIRIFVHYLNNTSYNFLVAEKMLAFKDVRNFIVQDYDPEYYGMEIFKNLVTICLIHGKKKDIKNLLEKFSTSNEHLKIIVEHEAFLKLNMKNTYTLNV